MYICTYIYIQYARCCCCLVFVFCLLCSALCIIHLIVTNYKIFTFVYKLRFTLILIILLHVYIYICIYASIYVCMNVCNLAIIVFVVVVKLAICINIVIFTTLLPLHLLYNCLSNNTHTFLLIYATPTTHIVIYNLLALPVLHKCQIQFI